MHSNKGQKGALEIGKGTYIAFIDIDKAAANVVCGTNYDSQRYKHKERIEV
jgi:hypothetical protein